MPKRAAKKKPSPRVERTRNNGRWTESRFKSFIVGVLRAAMRKWGAFHDAKKAAERGIRVDKATGRKRKMYECAGCTRLFKSDEVHVDHIQPVFDPSKRIPAILTDWTEVINRMFCEVENLQVLCHTCHGIKTENERKARYGSQDDS